jgi:hypothetical protein
MAKQQAGKVNRALLKRQIAWLISEFGLPSVALGTGRSTGWLHHVAHGNWKARVRPTPVDALLVDALYRFEINKHKAREDERRDLEQAQVHLASAAALLNHHVRRIARRRKTA